MEQYNFIIAGGGVSGLSLAYQMAHSQLADCSILVIEPRIHSQQDHALSFWTDQPTPFDPIISRSWSRLQVISEDRARSIDLGGYHYNTLRSGDFSNFIRQELSTCPNIVFLQASVDQIRDGAACAQVWAEGNEFSGQWVFDSRFRIADFDPDTTRYHSLRQHFKGWLIETKDAAFNPNSATLFDFRVPQSRELRFFYVLPYSDRRALVEYVLLSPENYDETIRSYIENTLGVRDYQILSKEGGVTPLSNYPFPRQAGRRVMAIGIQGGRVKPSSGYAFTRIQRDSAAIVRSLVRTGRPFDISGDAPFYRFCDSTLLQIMRKHGETVKPIYLALFENNPIDRIFHFLDETASPIENINLMLSLPLRLFWEGLFQVTCQHLGIFRRAL